jgi:hypothetical protein
MVSETNESTYRVPILPGGLQLQVQPAFTLRRITGNQALYRMLIYSINYIKISAAPISGITMAYSQIAIYSI